MFVVRKPPILRSAFIRATQIVRVCPLSPRFAGKALDDATPETAIERYDTFYINKYYTLSDYMYLNKL